MKKQLLMLMLVSLTLVSCKTIGYQVYEVQSPNLTQKDNSLVFENEDCKISYNLWSESGSMAFIFENKSGRDIFIDMTQSFFIKNGAAFDYYKNSSYETRAFEGVNIGYSVSNTYIGSGVYWPTRYVAPLTTTLKAAATAKAGISTAVTIKEPEFICIPAKAFKVIDSYKISPSFEKMCDKKIDYPKKSSIVKTYSENDTPLKFSNRLAYSFEKGGKSLNFVENTFWLSNIKNYSEKDAVEKRKEKLGCNDYVYTKRRYFVIGGPNEFYKSYLITQ